MANFNVTDYDSIVAAITTANGTTANDSLFFQDDVTLTAEQILSLQTPADTSGGLRFRSQQGPAGSPEVSYTLTVLNDLSINDSTTTTAQPSFTIGPFVLQIGNGGTEGGISGNLRADDGGVLAFNRSVDTTYTGTLSVEQEENGLRNDFAGTTVTFDGSQGTNGLAIRASQGTGAADEYFLELGGAGNGVISGIIGDGGVVTSPGTITKEDDGTWTLSGANTYLGLTTVSEGVINVQSATGLGATDGGTVVEDGATLAIESVAGIVIGAEALSLAGEGVADEAAAPIGALQNVSGDNTFGGAITLAADARINSDAGTLTLTGGIGGAFALTLGGDGDGAVDSVIGSDVTGLTKDGDGTWTLSGANTYGGETTVSGGTLLVDGSISGSVTTVGEDATLGGTGEVGIVIVQSEGTLAAGDNGIGELAIRSLVMVSGAELELEIGGASAGDFDRIDVTGALTLSGATLDLSLVNGFATTVGQLFTIIENDGTDAVSGTFVDEDGNALAEGGTVEVGGRSFAISYQGGDGNDVVLTVVNTPPEATDDAVSVVQRLAVDGNVITDEDADTDGDGGTLAVTLIAANGGATSAVDADGTMINGLYGTLSIASDGSYTYDANVEGRIAVGATATDTFTYTLSDGQTGTDTADLAVAVTGSAIGDAGANVFLLTGPGTTARGLAGGDLYVLDSAADRVIEAAGGGSDTVRSSATYTLSVNVESLQLTGSSNINATGNNGNNTIRGNVGDNDLTGGLGQDVLTGNLGADHFVFRALADSTVAASGRDTIRDFRSAQGDQIDLHLIDANTRMGSNQAFHFIGDSGFSREAGELQAKDFGSNTLVSGDVNGDGRADFSVLLRGHVTLDAGDFVL